MISQRTNIKFKQLDSYSMLIASKYLQSKNDFVNVICVCKKFKETTEKLRFNPISVTSLKLFPKIQTQYLYKENDVKIIEIEKYEIWYKVDYDEYLKNRSKRYKFHYINYTKNFFSNKYNIPYIVTHLGEEFFINCFELQSINLPSTIQSLGIKCFQSCISLQSINLPFAITSLGCGCFSYCTSLKSINIPSSLQSISNECFYYCSSLTTIDLPSSITSLGEECFKNCFGLKEIKNLRNIKIGEKCFEGCFQFQHKTKNTNSYCFVC
ncbi:Leucine rich repeat containing protein BspA family protein [Entamoeba marina]